MPAAATKRMERVEARIRSDQKERIETAAYLRGLSVTDFIVQHADAAAKKAIEEHEVWILRGEAAKAFAEAILSHSEPGPNLKAALKRHNGKRLHARKAN